MGKSIDSLNRNDIKKTGELDDKKDIRILLNDFHVPYKNLALYVQAFTHRSFSNEEHTKHPNDPIIPDYDRLEFVGDAALYLAFGIYTYHKYPVNDSGVLTNKRRALIEGSTLTKLAFKYDFDSYIRYSIGEKMNPHHEKILEDVFEAFIGAILLDLGTEFVINFIIQLYKENLEIASESETFDDSKSKIQNIAEKNFKVKPVYSIITQSASSVCPYFKIGCYIQDILIGVGEGPNRKIAEKNAASNALVNYVDHEAELKNSNQN